jgi:NADPH-dependent curcumin reductase CurA|tara:strand:+ start:6916 stop:7926 length:1011 start_codon:yes stop_codon:yes gene_type:complete
MLDISSLTNKQIYLKSSPKDKLLEDNFEFKNSKVKDLDHNQVLVEVVYISIDAANRAWMQGRTYRSQILPGDVMGGYALGKVIATNNNNFNIGDYVEGDLGWQNYAIRDAKELIKTSIKASENLHMSVLGITGKTAYFGLGLADLKKGETVLISAAAGAVGNVAGQIAKIKGCKVIGITSSDEKASWLKDVLGFDGVVNYKNDNFIKDLRSLCPEKVDVYFDNVGGPIFESVLFAMNNFGRIICCGAVSQYDQASPQNGPRGVPGLIVTKRLTLKGFIVMDFNEKEQEEAEKNLLNWINQNKIIPAEDIMNGLESTPMALIGLLNGDNKGKRLVKI